MERVQRLSMHLNSLQTSDAGLRYLEKLPRGNRRFRCSGHRVDLSWGISSLSRRQMPPASCPDKPNNLGKATPQKNNNI